MPKKSSRPLRIFLCHASFDKPKVRELYTLLNADGFDVWLDEVKLLPGQEWREEIPKAVEAVDIVIVCLSRQSINKEGYVQTEIRVALDVAQEKPEGMVFIIPARLEDCEVPRRLRAWQWVDLFAEDGYQRLKTSLLERAKNLGLTHPVKRLRKPASAPSPRSLSFSTIAVPAPPPVQEPKRSGQAVSNRLRSMPVRWALPAALILLVAVVVFVISRLGKVPAGQVPSPDIPAVENASATAFAAAPTSAVTLAAVIPLTPEAPFSTDIQTQKAHNAVLVTLRDGTSKFVASDWLVYSGGGSNYWELLTEFQFETRGSVPFTDIKSIDFGEELTNGHPVTIELSGGEKIDDKLDSSYSYGSLVSIMNEGEFNADFDEIRRMDFGQTADEPIAVNMATVVNSAGEEIQSPADLIEARFIGSGYAGPYAYVRDGWTTKSGMLVPFKLMMGLELNKNTDSSGYTMVYTLLDGRTITNAIDYTDSPAIRGITELGTFQLDMAEIKRIDFHRDNDQVLPPITTLLAAVTLQDGTVYEVPAYWLAFNSSKWQDSFSLVGYSNTYANEMKSLKIQTAEDPARVTAAIDLVNQQTITGKLRMSGDDGLVGVDTQGNFVAAVLKDVRQIDFQPGFTAPAGLAMATVIASDGTQFQMPLNSVRLLTGSSSWGQYSYSYLNEIALTTGMKIPFSRIRKFEVGKYDVEVHSYAVTIHLLDGQVLNSYFAESLSTTFAISGFTEWGPLQIEVNKVVSVDFNRKATDAQPILATMATVTLQNGNVSQIPVKWLVYNKWSWAASLPVFDSQSVPFNEMTSLTVEPAENDPFLASITIKLQDGRTITNSALKLVGHRNLIGIDVNGSLLDVRINDVKRIDFSMVTSLPSNVSEALVITADGERLQIPGNSLKIFVGKVDIVGYSTTYLDEIALTTGIKVPLSKIKKLEIGEFDSSVNHNPITIYTIDGQTIKSFVDDGSARTLGICGLTDNGPFNLYISEIKSVETGR